jgi:hypothetical protein
MVEYVWTVSGNGQLQGGQGTDTITYSVGPTLGMVYITLSMKDANGCENVCEIAFYCAEEGSVLVSFTQGFFGNPGGKFNGVGTLRLIQGVLVTPLVVGASGRSLTIPLESAECIIQRLPAGVTPTTLPDGFGDQTMPSDGCQTSPPIPLDSSGKWQNILLGQTVTLSLNVRISPGLLDFRLCDEFVTVKALPGPDGILGTEDDVPSGDPDDVKIFTIPQTILDILGTQPTVADLLVLANSALAGNEPDGLLSDINHAVSTINEAFDRGRFLVDDCYVRPIGRVEMPEDRVRTSGDETAADIARTQSELVSGSIDLPTTFVLHGSRPNPLRAGTEIRFDLPSTSSVLLDIFDVTGRRVRVLENGTRAPGRHAAAWDGRDQSGARVAAGIYFYRLQAGEFQDIRKMVVLR